MAHQHLVPLDATFEFRRAKASLGNKADGMDWLKFLEGKGAMDEVYKAMLSSILTVGERPCPREVKIEIDDVVEPRERPEQPDDRGKARISEDSNAQVPLGNSRCHHKKVKENNRLMQSQSDRVAQARPVKVKEEHEPNKKKEIKKENENTYQGRGSRKHVARGQTESKKAVRGDNGYSSKKAAFANSAVKKEPEPRLPMKGTDCQIRNVKPAKCSLADNGVEKKLEGEGSSRNDLDMIILDSSKVKEIASPFVCSKKYHSSMIGEGIDSEFRRELLEVLKKPYDRDEYQKSREEIRAGSYLNYHPDVQRKLTKYRYKREKCVIIVRGFLFWLQNLTREGAFEPWNDKQCLELELPSR